MNTGKRFEVQFRKSVPADVFYYRFKDSSNSWGSNSTVVRFTPSNICDCMLFDGNHLYLFELKSTKGKSLPLTNIRQNQIRELLESKKFENIIAGFIVNFSELNRCFFIDVFKVKKFIEKEERKSIPLEFFEKNGTEIDVFPKKVYSLYNVEKLLYEIGNITFGKSTTFFIDFMNTRYSNILKEKEICKFKYWDDYALFLFEEICEQNEETYYELLEKDNKIYSDIQTGIEREVEDEW